MQRAADPLLGRRLEGRYQLVRRIARGGMATVYEARDLRLQRTCAVKVMHADLGSSPDAAQEFRTRFVHEAHAAARLSHPNVVAVTDQGTDSEDGVLFLVMEHVPGRTLRDVVRDETPLRPEQALALLEPVLAALAEAHRCSLVHRDVKPENVLIADDGRVKVTDFGLARAVDAAANGSTHTATSSILIGTVSYLAPELIENHRADPRADVYAAGVVLFELLTGRKPHQGDGAIQIAYKHVHEDVPAPSTALRSSGGGGDLPAYVDALVLRATARDRDRRQADAKVFLQQVRRVRAALGAGVTDDPDLTSDLLPTRVLAVADGIDYVDETSGTAVHAHGSTAWTPGEETTVLVPVAATAARTGVTAEAAPAPPRAGTRVFAPVPEQRTGSSPTGARPAPARRRGRTPLLLLTVALVTALIAYGGWWLGIGRYTSTPGIQQLSTQAAEQKLAAAGLSLEVTEQRYSEVVPAGSIISTDPAAGSRITDGGTVEAVVSRGQERYEVPTVRAKPLAAAEGMITDAHLTVGDVERRYGLTVPEGSVITADPGGGTELRRDSPVDLVVSKGPRPIRTPDLAGQDADRAAQRLQGLGFEVDIADQQHSDTVEEGDVIAQSPDAGTGVRGDTIELTVSLGPVMVDVPDLQAMTVDEATAALTDRGLDIEVERTDLFVGLDRVVKQTPGADTSVPEGSTVTVSIV